MKINTGRRSILEAAAVAGLGGLAQAAVKMRKTGYVGSFMNFSVVGIDPLFSALGKEISGVVVSQVVPSPRSSATPIVKEYLAAIDNSDQSPSYESLEGFIAAKALTITSEGKIVR